MKRPFFVGAIALCLGACGTSIDVEEAEDVNGETITEGGPALTDSDIDAATSSSSEPIAVPTIPASLAPFGDGYPNAGNACRRLGESAATNTYLDDSATLVGCPTQAGANALGGTVVASIDGITLVLVPNRPVLSSPVAPRTVSGSLTGNDIASHSFNASEGQTINVTLSGRGTMYFNVIPPGGAPGDAIFVGSQAEDGDFWAGVAPATGQYQVIIYLMGNDRDSGAPRNYQLEFIAE